MISDDSDELSVRDRTRLLLCEAAHLLRDWPESKGPHSAENRLSNRITAFLATAEAKDFLGALCSRQPKHSLKGASEPTQQPTETIATGIMRCMGKMHNASPYHPIIQLIAVPITPERIDWQALAVMRLAGQDPITVIGLRSQSIHESIHHLQVAIVEAVNTQERNALQKFQELRDLAGGSAETSADAVPL